VNNVENISSLSNDVLKQAEASLAAFIGGVNYSDQFAVAAAVQSRDMPEFDEGERGQGPPVRAKPKASSLFDIEKLASCVGHANKVANTYGVTVISINVIGAAPADNTLQTTLAQGAVAAAEANKFETVARGRASAALIEAKGLGDAEILRAQGEAEAARIRAEGAKGAADTIADSEVAVRLAMVEKTGQALGDKASFFFGTQPQALEGLLAPALAAAAGAAAPASRQ